MLVMDVTNMVRCIAVKCWLVFELIASRRAMTDRFTRHTPEHNQSGGSNVPDTSYKMDA